MARGSSLTSRPLTPTTTDVDGARAARTQFETSPTRVAEPDPCCPSDTATAAVARPARCWNGLGGCGTSKDLPASSSKIPTRSFGPRRRSTRTLRCGRVSSIWSCIEPPSRLRPIPRPTTVAASICCARPSSGRSRRHCVAGATYPYEQLDRLWKIGLAPPVPRHSARAARSPGCTGKRRRRTARLGTSSEQIIARARRSTCAR